MASNLKNESDRSDVCRDFLRNECFRGKKCKYFHPNENTDDPENSNKQRQPKEVAFCHDYQNNGCARRNCRYIHCRKEEEELYRSTGQLPDEPQVCRDHLHGECRRTSCKFRHILPQKRLMNSEGGPMSYEDSYEPMNKFRAVDDYYRREPHDYRGELHEPPDYKGEPYGSSAYRSEPAEDMYYRRDRMDYYGMLEEENQMLCSKVKELKKQVAYLTSHNELLLEQNAHLRMSHKSYYPSDTATTTSTTQNVDWTADLKLSNDVQRNGYSWS